MSRRLISFVAGVILLGANPAMAQYDDEPFFTIGQIPNHREMMRDILIELSAYAKSRDPNFVVLTRNGIELLTRQEREARWEELRAADDVPRERGVVHRRFMRAVDGLVLQELYCDRRSQQVAQKPAKPDPKPHMIEARSRPKVLDATPFEKKTVDQIVAELIGEKVVREAPPIFPGLKTPQMQANELAAKLRGRDERRQREAIRAVQREGRRVLSIEACVTIDPAKALKQGAKEDIVVYPHGDLKLALDRIPRARPPYENADAIGAITQVKNFLPMLHNQDYGTRGAWVVGMEDTNWDALLIDIFHRGRESLLPAEIAKLKFKNLGSRRLVIAVLDIGMAADNRFYWQRDWRLGMPDYLALNGETPGTFVVEYWHPDWKAHLGTMIKGIVDMGFDGVMFNNVDVYQMFEKAMPLPEE